LSAAHPERRSPEFFPAVGSGRTEPDLSWSGGPTVPPASPAPVAQTPVAQASAPTGAVGFETDAPAAPSSMDFAPQTRALLDRLLDLLRRPDAPSPFAIGLFAPPGAGKTSALNWLAAQLGSSGATAIVTLKASDLATEPERALAAALYRALSPRHGQLTQEAAQEGARFGADPATLARAAHERLDGLRRKLNLEKQALVQTETRRAAIKETLLYETPGTRVDAYARKIRSAFEPRLRRFGFTGEPLAVFKDLTRDVNERGGLVPRLLASLRALYAYRGQTRLLLLSASSFGMNQGLAWLAVNKPVWLGVVSSAGSIGAQTADFLRTHLDWLPMAAQGFALVALALLGLNIWRAFDFMQPLVHAAGLLDEDIAARRHEIDQSVAHHARNVERLSSEAESAARKAEDADRRAAAAGGSGNPPAFVETDEAAQNRSFALGFLESLSDLLDRGAFPGAPRRLVVALDGFESVEAPAALFARLHERLARPGLIAVYALDAKSFEAAPDALARRIQLPVRLDAGGAGDPLALAPLDAPLSQLETRLASAVGPLAGDSPRAQKRLRNLLRFLRPSSEAGPGLASALALLLAADIGATPADREALLQALRESGDGFAPKGSVSLQHALATAASVAGTITIEDARQAAALARQVSV
jgi:hypothetical protein